MKLATRYLLLALALYILLGIFVTTIVAFFDEGNHVRYPSILAYIEAEAYPPLLDYLVWCGISVVSGIMTLVYLSKSERVGTLSPMISILLSLVMIPVIFGLLVIMVGGMIYLVA